ncbi:Protein TBRG4 [Dufourea novaeangliae]|uniref:Protein TBRG4 n=2 Tax=Dufourea novaeangliae TaxID=178035 RepID=A0A154NWB7_DUFNO|nr:Protein TBRG4 [Dufourea novaeangliae]
MNKEQLVKFNELKTTLYNTLKTQSIIAPKVQRAETIQDLLNLMKMPHLSRSDILNVMQTIIQWINKSENSSFIQSNKFILKEGINEAISTNNIEAPEVTDFSRYTKLSTSSMIKEVLQLAKSKSRKPKELKFLCDNITDYKEKLSVGECSTLMYSMCALNYCDERLLAKISSNLMNTVCTVKSGAVRSILKSMAVIKYKNNNLLAFICNVMMHSKEKIEPAHIVNIIYSFATLGFDSDHTSAVIEKYEKELTQDSVTADDWLHYVWSLVILNKVKHSFLESVLCDKFIMKMFSKDSSKHVTRKLKLLNISGAAKFSSDYNGPLLDNNAVVKDIVVPLSKQKVLYVKALEETLKSLAPSPSSLCYRINVNTKMGFFLDAECFVNSKSKLVSTTDTTVNNIDKVAIIIHDYFSYCYGSNELHGIYKLYNRLLENSGYKVLQISYQHFGLEDKLVKREQFLEMSIQSLK